MSLPGQNTLPLSPPETPRPPPKATVPAPTSPPSDPTTRAPTPLEPERGRRASDSTGVRPCAKASFSRAKSPSGGGGNKIKDAISGLLHREKSQTSIATTTTAASTTPTAKDASAKGAADEPGGGGAAKGQAARTDALAIDTAAAAAATRAHAGSQHTTFLQAPQPVSLNSPASHAGSTSGHATRGSSPLAPDMDSATRAVAALQLTHQALVVVAAGLKAASWLPLVGSCVSVVADMVDAAANVAVGKVSALRLVERSANIVVAVEKSIEAQNGQLAPAWEDNINALLDTLHDISYLLIKLSKRSFLKLYLRSDETQGLIDGANQHLQDCVTIFELQSFVAIGAWETETKEDARRDFEALAKKIDEARESDQAMLVMLQMKSNEQQEAIKTLQRSLDYLLQIHESEWAEHHPDSPMPGIAPSASPASHPPPVWQTRALFSTVGDRRSQQSSTSGSSLFDAGSSSPRGSMGSVAFPHDLPSRKDFYQKALTALRRISGDGEQVPDWTITPFEVTHDERLSQGFFSAIWKGVYNGTTVAIKELNQGVDRNVNVWRSLRSPFILDFLGASSTTGPPPWFLVSPYMENGNILAYLAGERGKDANRFALVHQISQGLEYLHSRSATNVLVNNAGQAVICDFGLSQIKLEISRKSATETTTPDRAMGTLRWQSPERILGGDLTAQVDIYAFGITLYEIYSGNVPFGYVDDSLVRRDIRHGKRPPRATAMPDGVWALEQRCWAQLPGNRPLFHAISTEVAAMYDAPPSMRPVADNSERKASQMSASSSTESYETAPMDVEEQQAISPQPNVVVLPDDDKSTSSGSIRSIPSHLGDQVSNESDRTERSYRHALRPHFDDRLAVPLWLPVPVALGTVGYVRHGTFYALFDTRHPPMHFARPPPQPYLDEFSTLQTVRQPVNAMSAARVAYEKLWFTFTSGKVEKQIARRYSFTLQPGMKQAGLVVEDAVCEIYDDLVPTKEYLKANIDWILECYGDTHHLAREDVMIVFGTLTARRYAMFVSNFVPQTTFTFNVYAEPSAGAPWGVWAIASAAHKDDYQHKHANKVANVTSSPPDAVLLGRWQFVAGSGEPILGML